MMNLFALTGDAARRILRLPLSQNIQNEVENLFKTQEAEFYSASQQLIDFDGKYKPDDGECLIIKNYADIDDLHGAIQNPLAVPEIDADPAEFAGVKALFTGYVDAAGDRLALIQSFDKRKIISASGLSIFHSANVYRKVDGVGLTLDSKISAVLKNDDLKFFNFHILRRIFDVSEYYVEATNADLDAFLAKPTIHISDPDTFTAIADSWIRRKVTLITQSNILENVDANTIKTVAARFGIDVSVRPRNGQDAVELPLDKAELKRLLRFLDEDYFQSSLQNLNHMTNSKRLV